MEQAGIILIIAITGCLIALILLSARQKKLEESSYISDKKSEETIKPVTDTMKTSTEAEKKKETEKKPAQQYISMYSWNIPQEKRICAHCDAENWPRAVVCEVCNEELR